MPMSPEVEALAKSVAQTNEIIAGFLAHANDAPSSVQVDPETKKKAAVQPGEGEAPPPEVPAIIQRRLMTSDAMEKTRETLRPLSLRQLHAGFATQMMKKDQGVPLLEWVSAGGRPLGDKFGQLGGELDPSIAKALDSTAGSALIRQDLEPFLYEIYVKTFPMFDLIEKEPANGLVHAYDQQTDFGDADFIGELDTVTDDKGTYVRQFTNVAILATRRGVSLKNQFAVLQSGSGFNPERLELQGGMRAMAKRYQKTILQGNWSDAAGLLTNEKGAYDADSFDGFRKVLNTASAVNVDPATNPDTTGSLRRAFDAAILPITESGGTVSGLWGTPFEQTTYNEQQDDKLRILQEAASQVNVGVQALGVMTNEGRVPFYGVKGGAITSYTATGTYSGNTVRDIYALDLDSITIPYLGSEGPTVIEVPMGASGQLTHLFIIFFMGGLKIAVPNWSNKVRVKVA